ncbi:MAG: ABC transporter substrate-binding protein [Oligoflexus sp.]
MLHNAFIVLLLLAICACNFGKRPSNQLQPIHIALPKALSMGLIILAYEHGYFTEQGLDVHLDWYPSGRDASDALFQGKADLAASYDTVVIINNLQGRKQKIYSKLHSAKFSTAVLARKDHGIERPDQILGKTVGVPFRTNAQYFLESWLENELIRSSLVNIRNTDPEDLQRLLLSGEIDALAVWEPYLSEIKAELGDNGIIFELEDYMENSFLIGDSKKEKPIPIEKVLHALYKAQQLLNQDDQAFDTVFRALDFANKETMQGIWDKMFLDLGVNHILLTQLLFQKYFLIESQQFMDLGPRLSSDFDTKPLASVQPFLVTLVTIP